jgi:hypothetical protein
MQMRILQSQIRFGSSINNHKSIQLDRIDRKLMNIYSIKYAFQNSMKVNYSFNNLIKLKNSYHIIMIKGK